MNDENRRPSYFKPYNHHTSSNIILTQLKAWLSLNPQDRPHFITLYFHEVDDAGHLFGPNSTEVNQAIQKMDTLTKKILNTIETLSIKDSLNLIFVSDHGMTEIDNSRVIYLNDSLFNKELIIQLGFEMAMLHSTNKKLLQQTYNHLNQHRNHYKVFWKNEMPPYYHYNKNSLIGDIIIIPEVGWVLQRGDKAKSRNIKGGTHGYDNRHLDMQGIFIASGPLFKKKYTTNVIQNIDIYPLLCKIFNIQSRNNIDGNIKTIREILK